MRILSAWLVLLAAAVGGVAAKEEALRTTDISSTGDSPILTPQVNRNGWVNPEDLAPMPQCIAQQDQSAWLSTMTKCTGRQCTRHFGRICTHHQWLTQLTCLSTGFTPDVIRAYFPYCSRSVLAKAQLYQWIRSVTGRTWLVDIGDANELETLSPASLVRGYAAIDVTQRAPACLIRSTSSPSMEPFQHVMASCSFTSVAQHTGNAARPWEYHEPLRSIVPLDFETVGYNLTHRSIMYGDYFDKHCFCSAFIMDPKEEPCSGPGQLDLTKERLWMYAICGPSSLPSNWRESLKTTEFAFIPSEDWHWPKCFADMPKQVIELADHCATNACEVDSDGYCQAKRAVDRACFCRNINYDSCGGSCHVFETRIDYVKWLHQLCSKVPDWHGLPDGWSQLAAPTVVDLRPWRWTVKSSNSSDHRTLNYLESTEATETCASNEWKLGGFALVNVATLLATLVSQRSDTYRHARSLSRNSASWHWVLTGISAAILHILANLFNAFLVQSTFGYRHVPVIQLTLLWCSIPRLAWIPLLRLGKQPTEEMDLSTAKSSLFADMILQLISLYYMMMTIGYGWKHNFYFGGLQGAEQEAPAKMMYAGALVWLFAISMTLPQLMQATYKIETSIRTDGRDLPKWQRSMRAAPKNTAERLTAQLNERCTRFNEELADHWTNRSSTREETPLMGGERGIHTKYGTTFVERQDNQAQEEGFQDVHVITVMSVLLVWAAQWLFWIGFIGLSSQEYCPPNVGYLTAVWIAFSLAGVIVGVA